MPCLGQDDPHLPGMYVTLLPYDRMIHTIREFKIPRRRRVRKGHLKSEFVFFQSLSRLWDSCSRPSDITSWTEKPVVASGAKCQLFSRQASFEDISHFLFGFFTRLVEDVGNEKL